VIDIRGIRLSSPKHHVRWLKCGILIPPHPLSPLGKGRLRGILQDCSLSKALEKGHDDMPLSLFVYLEASLTMCPISGSIIFSSASFTALSDPGRQMMILPSAAPAMARLRTLPVPISW
jgi:hypothetical protein